MQDEEASFLQYVEALEAAVGLVDTFRDFESARRILIPSEGKSMEEIEAEAITHTLALTRGNRSAASRILGISRPTLLRKIRKFGI